MQAFTTSRPTTWVLRLRAARSGHCVWVRCQRLLANGGIPRHQIMPPSFRPCLSTRAWRIAYFPLAGKTEGINRHDSCLTVSSLNGNDYKGERKEAFQKVLYRCSHRTIYSIEKINLLHELGFFWYHFRLSLLTD